MREWILPLLCVLRTWPAIEIQYKKGTAVRYLITTAHDCVYKYT